MKHTPAVDSLLDLLSPCPPGRERRMAPSSLSPADWSEFVQLAGNYRVAPLLYWRLRRCRPVDIGPSLVPPDVETALQRLYYSSTLTNERLLHQLGRVVAALESAGIAAIVLKGAHLAALIYEQPALRSMTDVDLLVRKTDLPAVAGILVGLGYRHDQACAQARQQAQEETGRVKPSHARYARPDSRIALEVHWDIKESDSPLQIDLDGLWERAGRATIARANAYVLCPEDLLLHLCVHASFHHFLDCNGLRSLCDIGEVTRHFGDEMDWGQFLRRARGWGAGRAAYLTLRMSAILLGVPVPAAVMGELQPPEYPDRILQLAEEQLLADPAAAGGPDFDSWGRVWSASGRSGKVREVLRVLFPPPAHLAQKYSLPPAARSVYLFYPVHVADLCRKHARRAWLLFRNDRPSTAWAQHQRRRVEQQEIRRWVTLN